MLLKKLKWLKCIDMVTNDFEDIDFYNIYYIDYKTLHRS